MSNALYDAIIALDRSARDATNGGWICGMLFDTTFDGPKCVNGLITWHLGENRLGAREPCYITNGDMTDEQREAALIAGRALLKTVPEEVLEHVGFEYNDEEIDVMGPGCVENRLIDINDVEVYDDDLKRDTPVLNGMLAAAWFNRALELLAQQMPEPFSVNDLGRIVL